jgi:formamidopyrimidine-DNA glycosylase
MPELPEVEVTRLGLEPKLLGRRIQEVRTTPPSYFFLTAPRELRRRLLERRIEGLRRHGKYLLMDLDDESSMLLHLGMTGQLFTRDARSPRLLGRAARTALDTDLVATFQPDEHTHLELEFDDRGAALLFRDVRKFGKVRWIPRGQVEPRLAKLGPDALGIDGALLFERGRARKAKVKSLLLDQGVLAGVGNIYADEALFSAAVRPGRAAHRVTRAEYERIAKAIVSVLERSIERGGSSIDDYISPDGSDGGYQREHRVYGRGGEPCVTCGRTIIRTVIGGRSSHYCPHCQK